MCLIVTLEMTTFIYNYIQKEYAFFWCRSFVSDHGDEFENHLFKSYCDEHEI
jgi:hypothetical protein